MQVFGHEDILMQQVSATAIRLQAFQEQLSPLLIRKKRPALPRLRGDEVCVTCGCLLSRWSQIEVPQGLKPGFLVGLYGAPKGAPLRKHLCWHLLFRTKLRPQSFPLYIAAPIEHGVTLTFGFRR